MKKILLSIVLLCSMQLLFADKATVTIEPIKDGLLIGSGLALNLPGFIVSHDQSLLPEQLNLFDSLAVFPYSDTQDKISSLLAYGLLLSPSVFIFDDSLRNDILPISVLYLESFLLSNGIKETIKAYFPRYRPYTRFPNYPNEGFDEISSSFLSGHTTLAFMSAGFLTSILNIYDIDNTYKLPIIVSGYSIATTVAILRLTSGSHYLSDVFCGAALGSLIGYAIPYFHVYKSDNVTINLKPNNLLSLSMKISY